MYVKDGGSDDGTRTYVRVRDVDFVFLEFHTVVRAYNDCLRDFVAQATFSLPFECVAE